MGLKLYVFLQNKYSCWERNVNVHRKCSIWTNHYQINTYLRHKWTVLSVYILQEMKTPFLFWVNNRFVTDACRKSTNEKNISSRMRIANAIFSTYIWRRDFWFRIPSILVLKMRWILFISKKKKNKRIEAKNIFREWVHPVISPVHEFFVKTNHTFVGIYQEKYYRKRDLLFRIALEIHNLQ